MIIVEIKKTYTPQELDERRQENQFTNRPIAAIKQTIFEDMLMKELPMRITLDNGEIITDEEN